MSFGKDVSNFVSSVYEQQNKMTQHNIEEFLKKTLGEDVALVKGFDFDEGSNKFTYIDAPQDVILKISNAGYYDL